MARPLVDPVGQSRRSFLKRLLLAQAGLMLLPSPANAAAERPFSFVMLGDLHFDKLEHHDLDWLQRDKPDDVRQVRDYTRISRDIMPRLFQSVQQAIAEAQKSRRVSPAFVLQVGDLVEGLCGSEERAARQNAEALDFVRGAELGAPFLFTKGNHDVTGAGAVEAFQKVFHPFMMEQTRALNASNCTHDGARYAFEYSGAHFLFFDAYDKDSLPWLQAALARRSARHCFVILHPPVVPYGARSTWHIFSRDKEKSLRDELLSLLGKHEAFVLCGHIHKYNLISRKTPGGGRFVQLAICSVVDDLAVSPRNLLSGVENYNQDQVTVEPEFSPGTEKERRAIYATEAPFVKRFEYAHLPGYTVVSIRGSHVAAEVYPGASRRPWRTLNLSEALRV